jgi:hypothetical protein
MDKQLQDFLDFMYNEVLVGSEPFTKARNYITVHYGKPAPGSAMDVFCDWYDKELGTDE